MNNVLHSDFSLSTESLGNRNFKNSPLRSYGAVVEYMPLLLEVLHGPWMCIFLRIRKVQLSSYLSVVLVFNRWLIKWSFKKLKLVHLRLSLLLSEVLFRVCVK